MKRTLTGIILLIAALVVCRGAAAQEEPCRLERAVAPDYGGVMLGMTVEELARMFPGSEELQKGPGDASTSKPFVVSLGMLELGVRKEQFRDVEEVVLTFIGGRLERLDVRYREPVAWRTVSEFSETASRRLAVPSEAWGAPASDPEKQSRVLDCRGFSIVTRIDRHGPSTLSIVDTGPLKGEAADRNAPSAQPPRPRTAKTKRTPKSKTAPASPRL